MSQLATEQQSRSLYQLLAPTTINNKNCHRHISPTTKISHQQQQQQQQHRHKQQQLNRPINNNKSFSTSYSSSSFLFNAFVIVQLLFIIASIIPNGQHGINQVECSSLVENSNQRSNGQGPNRCPNGWLWFNNKCWVASNSRRNFVHAIELCRKMFFDSTLPTIHSEEENEFLRNNIELDTSPIWLYSRHNHQYNRTRWLDKSPVNYTRWDNGQPSDKSSLVCIKTEDSWYMKKSDPVEGQTECVSFWADAKWGTQVGCQVLLPVVCEMKLQPVKRNNETTTSAELITPNYSSASSLMDNQLLSTTFTIISILITALPQLTVLSSSFFM